MNILYETDQLVLEYEHESTWLKNKVTGEILLEDEFYGDPECGLIAEDNIWAIVAGEHLSIWTPEKSQIKLESLKWVHSLRSTTHDSVEVLTDPWGENPSIWRININTFEVEKIRDFLDYQGKAYSDDVLW